MRIFSIPFHGQIAGGLLPGEESRYLSAEHVIDRNVHIRYPGDLDVEMCGRIKGVGIVLTEFEIPWQLDAAHQFQHERGHTCIANVYRSCPLQYGIPELSVSRR